MSSVVVIETTDTAGNTDKFEIETSRPLYAAWRAVRLHAEKFGVDSNTVGYKEVSNRELEIEDTNINIGSTLTELFGELGYTSR